MSLTPEERQSIACAIASGADYRESHMRDNADPDELREIVRYLAEELAKGREARGQAEENFKELVEQSMLDGAGAAVTVKELETENAALREAIIEGDGERKRLAGELGRLRMENEKLQKRYETLVALVKRRGFIVTEEHGLEVRLVDDDLAARRNELATAKAEIERLKKELEAVPTVTPTAEGRERYPPDGLYDGIPCTCKPGCPGDCKGACGCNACRAAYGDFLSTE